MSNIVIRKVNVDDAEQFVKLRNFVWRNAYKKIFPNEVFVAKEAKEKAEIENFNNTFFNDNKVLTYVAEINGKIVGLLWGKMQSEYPHYFNLGYADLMAMYIHPDYQGLGIASKFKDVFINWAKENGATSMVIGVLKDNEKARKVYEKWGGQLDSFTNKFVQLDKEYEEVFYIYNLK